MQLNRIKIGLCTVMISTLFSVPIAFGATKPVPVLISVNDKELPVFDEEVNKDMPALIYNGRTMMPLKKTFSIFGLNLKWDGKQQIIESVTETGDTIWLQIGNKNAKVAGKTVVLDVPAKIIDNRTYVPLAFIAKAVGSDISWDTKNKFVKVYTDGSELLNLSAIPKQYNNRPNRLNDRIYFDGKNQEVITVTKMNSSFDNAIIAVSQMLFVQPSDFVMKVNEQSVRIAVYEDKFMNLKRCNLVIHKSNTVFMIEVIGLETDVAVDFARKFIK